MSLIDTISSDIIKVPLESDNKTDVLHELVAVLYDAGRIQEIDPVLEAVRIRENQGSTGLEKGFAVPHAKTDAVNTLTTAIGIAPSGIDFDSKDGELSSIFFLLIAPPNESGPHVEALKEIAELSLSPIVCKMLRNAETSKEVLELIRD